MLQVCPHVFVDEDEHSSISSISENKYIKKAHEKMKTSYHCMCAHYRPMCSPGYRNKFANHVFGCKFDHSSMGLIRTVGPLREKVNEIFIYCSSNDFYNWSRIKTNVCKLG